MAHYELIGSKMSIRFPEESDAEIIKKLTSDVQISPKAAMHIITSNKNAQVVAVAVVEESTMTAYTHKNETITITALNGEKPDVFGLLDILC